MKILNSIGPRINPWGTPLTTGLQLDFVLLIIPLSSAVHFSVHLTIHSSSPHFISFSLRTLQEVKEYCVERLTKICVYIKVVEDLYMLLRNTLLKRLISIKLLKMKEADQENYKTQLQICI